LFMSDSLTVTAASQETMTMLGVGATAVHRPGLPSCSGCSGCSGCSFSLHTT
jgi:hypothetical protein